MHLYLFNRVETIPSKEWGADKAVRGQGTKRSNSTRGTYSVFTAEAQHHKNISNLK